MSYHFLCHNPVSLILQILNVYKYLYLILSILSILEISETSEISLEVGIIQYSIKGNGRFLYQEIN